MKAKTIIVLATLLAFGQGAWAQTSSFPETDNEKGTEAKPFLIENIEDLNALASDVNSGTDYSGTYFKLTADLDYSGMALFDTDEDDTEDSNFTTIGYGDETEGASFKGIFNGNDKYIKGITVNTPSAAGVGLFGYIFQPAEIRNLTLKNCSFTGNFEVGAIAGASSGSATNSTFGIYDCTVESTVKVTAVTTTIESEDYPGTYAGGIIGFCGSLTVSDCTSAATVKGDESVGGIAGHITGSTLGGVIDNCFFSGSVTGGTEATEVGTIVGGRGPIDVEEGTIGTINLTLYDADGDAIKNAMRLSNYDGLEANVTLSGRTLYKDNSWNTICLPFAMTAEQVTAQLAPTKLMTLSTATFDDGTLTLNFADATEGIEAGKPYIIKWASGDNFTPTFEGVTVSSTAPTDVEGTAANFHGIYSPYSTGGENKSMLYLGASNKLYYPSADMTINAFRAYFTLNGIEAGPTSSSAPAAARAFVLNFGDGDGATGILSLSADSKDSKDNAAWYDMQGRRLSGKPTASGIYINSGNKVVIK